MDNTTGARGGTQTVLWLIGVAGVVAMGTFGVTQAVMSTSITAVSNVSTACQANLDASEKAAAACEARAKVDLDTCRTDLGKCDDSRSECARELAARLSCEIPKRPLESGPEGRSNSVTIVLKGTSGDPSKPKLVLAAQVFDGRGYSWSPAGVLDYRDGEQGGTVFIGTIPPNGSIVPVVLREYRQGAIGTKGPIKQKAGFDVLCSMPSG